MRKVLEHTSDIRIRASGRDSAEASAQTLSIPQAYEVAAVGLARRVAHARPLGVIKG